MRNFASLFFCCLGLTSLLTMLSGCQTARYVEFAKLKLGMSKDQVLEVAGGPSVRDRKQGVDRWSYHLYDHPEGEKVVREIHFQEGVAVYVGPKPVPSITAEQQDLANDIQNRAHEEASRADYSSVNRQYEIQRFEPVESEDDEGPVQLQSSPKAGSAK